MEVRDDLYDAGGDEVSRVVAGTDEQVHTVVVVGHNPTMTVLALDLAGATGDAVDRLRQQGLPTAGCAVLGLESWDADGAELLSFLTPREY